MKTLSREAIQRMVDFTGGAGGIGGGGSDFAGMATQSWVDENYLSIAFFSKLFKAYDSASTPNEIKPNDTESTITNIKAMFGFWTNQYISALGQNSGGGGGGASALADLTDVALSSPTNGQALVYNATSGKWENQTIGGGGGGGTLTSIGLVMPTGFSVSPATLTADGSFTVSFATGYGLPLTADVNKGVTAYGWGNHADAGYLLSSTAAITYATPSSVATQMQNYAYISSGTIQIGNSSITPLTQHQTVDGTFWGQSWSNGGTVKGSIEAGNNGGYIGGFDHIDLNTHGSLSGYGGYIDFYFNGASGYTSRIIEDASGRLYLAASNGVRIGDAVLKWDSTNSALYIEKADGTAAGFYATGFVSALGLSSGSGGQIGFDLIPSTSESYSLGSAANGWKELRLADNGEDGRIYVSGDGVTIFSSTNEVHIDGDLIASLDVYSRYTKASRFYLDSSRYIYLDNGVLKYYNGTTAKTISLE